MVRSVDWLYEFDSYCGSNDTEVLMSLLRRVRPAWLRLLLYYALSLLATIAGLLLIFALASILTSRRLQIGVWAQQYVVLLVVSFVLFVVLVYIWNTYQTRKNKATARWIKKADKASRLGRHEEALALFDVVLSHNPHNAASWLNKGVALFNLKRYDEALEHFDQALQLKPNYALACYSNGKTLTALKRFDEALAAYDQALSLDPGYSPAWNNKASILCDDLKRYADALAVCEEALAQNISIAGIWAIKGDALHALGHDDEAHGAYETVLTFPTDDFLSWAASTSSALAGLGRFDEALAAFESALTFHTDSADIWRKKAEVLRALGREDEAREAEQRADELER